MLTITQLILYLKKSLQDLETTIQSSSRTSIHVTIATARYLVKRNEILGDSSGQIASFCMVTDGKTTTFGGHGHLIESFITNKQLSGYVGEDENVSKVFDTNYETAKLKLMRFDQSFENMPYDASRRKLPEK